VFKKIDFETTVANIGAYLYRSIKNKISDIIRKPKYTVSLTSFEDVSGSNILLETTGNEVESVDLAIERKEMYQQINQALQLLPEKYRQILVATEYDGKTIRELADEWDIPLGTLLSRRHRALSKLQKSLKNSI
jgi:RNA polymerase sigma-70 factor (ECF subfamily)